MPKEFDERIHRYISNDDDDFWETHWVWENHYEYIQYALWDIRCNYRATNMNYSPVDDDETGFNIFSDEEWQSVCQALVNEGFVNPNFDMGPVNQAIGASVVGYFWEDIYDAPFEFFNWCYEHLGGRKHISISNELLKTIVGMMFYSPEQRALFKWISENGYYIVTRCNDAQKKEYFAIYRGSDYRDYELTEAEQDVARSVKRILDMWKDSANLYKTIEAALTLGQA
ncbi:hypothetical protein IKX12_01245 [Candidatus Saccharibacteria bacterium]|nr:hypothetical protein [Candidatus Saccharibacteria bacterium]